MNYEAPLFRTQNTTLDASSMKRKPLTTTLGALLPLAAAVPLLVLAFWILWNPASNSDSNNPAGQASPATLEQPAADSNTPVEPRSGLLDSSQA